MSCVRCGGEWDGTSRICPNCSARGQGYSAQAQCTAKALASPVCKRCGHSRDQHAAVNYANGAWVSGETWICPTAFFAEER